MQLDTTKAYERYSSQFEVLIEQCARRETDLNFEKHGGKVLYAVDNDVVTLITAPWRFKAHDYLKVLTTGDSGVLESLARLLANYFLAPKRGLPYLIVHPAEIEQEAMWNRVFRKATHEAENVTAELDRAIESLADGGAKIEDSHLFELLRSALAIVEGAPGPITELDRIARLAGSTNLVRVGSVKIDDKQVYVPDYFNPEVEKKIERYTEKWLSQLQRSRPSPQASDIDLENNLVDAGVMARIQWINEQYESDKANLRFCLITGDQHIEKVGCTRPWGANSFSHEFIRSPMSFLADHDFFTRAGVKPPAFIGTNTYYSNTFADWTRVSFPERKKSRTGRTKAEIVEQFDRVSEDWSKFLQSNFSESVVSDKSFRDEIEEYLSASKHMMTKEIHAKYTNLVHRVRSITDGARANFGGASALAGFWNLPKVSGQPKRSIPGIRFDELTKASEHVQRLRNSRSITELQKVVDRQWIMDLQSEDTTQYTTFIVFSLAFAIAQEWHQALTVAKSAVMIALRHKKDHPKSLICGDEAAYLCAVLSRMCMTNKSDLDESEFWLEQAESIASKFHRELHNNTDFQDLRFDCERLAISISTLWFALKESGQNSFDKSILVIDSLNRLCLQHLDIYEKLRTEQQSHIRGYLQEQVEVNFLQLQIMAISTKTNSALMGRPARELLLSLMSKNGETESTLTTSKLVQFVIEVGKRLFLSEKEKANYGTLEIQEIRKIGKELEFFPYDDFRVQFFIETLLDEDVKLPPEGSALSS